VLPAYIIDQLKREQEEIDRRFEETRLPLYLPLPEPPLTPRKEPEPWSL
jgi:hypothetical protein